MSLYDFYAGLEKKTDNTGTLKMKVSLSLYFQYSSLLMLLQFRYPTVSRIMRQYRYLIMLLRGGVGNTPARDLDDLKPGELAVLCPACPRPDVNIPAEWESAPLELKFVPSTCYRSSSKLIMSLDSCIFCFFLWTHAFDLNVDLYQMKRRIQASQLALLISCLMGLFASS